MLGTAEVPRLMEVRTVRQVFLYGRPVHPANGARLGAKPGKKEYKKKKRGKKNVYKKKWKKQKKKNQASEEERNIRRNKRSAYEEEKNGSCCCSSCCCCCVLLLLLAGVGRPTPAVVGVITALDDRWPSGWWWQYTMASYKYIYRL